MTLAKHGIDTSAMQRLAATGLGSDAGIVSFEGTWEAMNKWKVR
ncbi:MAG: hypothetical protein ACKVPY_06040 [Paracoccaceae bacterium]